MPPLERSRGSRRRSWAAAHAKVADEGQCRWCGSTNALDPSHIVPRSRVNADGGAEDPRNIVPLCREHHTLYDAGRLELLGSLTREEQVYVVSLVGLGEAFRRTTNRELAA